MRIAFFAKSHRRTRVTAHMARGLRTLGHQVVHLNPHGLRRRLGPRLARRWIRRRLRELRPELVLVFSRDIDLDLLRELSGHVPTAQFYDDCNVPLREDLLTFARLVDHLFVTAGGQVPEYLAAGVRSASWATEGCDPHDHRPVRPRARYASEVAFIGKPGPAGGAKERERVALVQRLARHFDLRVYGPGWEGTGIRPARRNVFPRQYRAICASSQVMIGIDVRSDVELYFSNRTWLTLGCGGVLCTRYVPRLEKLFDEGRHLVWWRDPDECVERVRSLLGDPTLRTRLRTEGRALAARDYTFARCCERMMATLAERGIVPAERALPRAAPAG